MDCFDGLIGIKGTCGEQTVPDSGLYLQDLPNINMQIMDSAIGRDAISAYDELERKLELAGVLVVNELRTALASKFRINSEVENSRVGFVKDNLETQPAQANYIGANIRVNQYPFLQAFITRVGLHLQTSGAVDVKVINLVSGKVLDTIPITTVADVPTYVDVYKKYNSEGQTLNLAFVYDATATGSYKTQINPNWCRTCAGSWYNNNYSQIRGVTLPLAGPYTDQNLTSIDNTGGVLIDYSLGCDIERFACSIKHSLILPLWYRAGILILETIIHSKRFNPLISLFKDDYEETRSQYQALYDQHLSQSLNTLIIPNDICFICRPKTKTEINFP